MGKILKVNLTSKIMSEEPLPDDDVLRKYVGCFGLGQYYFDKLYEPGAGPLDPGNPLIFLSGPLTGTDVPSPTNMTLTTLNAETHITVGRSHTHGWWGPRLISCGYDGIIVEGESNSPLYLYISEEGTSLHPADEYWGMDTHETEEAFKEKFGDDVSVAAIGPAGENGAAGALIANDKNHSFSHSSVGTIMGSKNLKAIVVEEGSLDKPVVDPEKLQENAKEWRTTAREEGLFPVVGDAGVPNSEYEGVKELVGLISKNMTTNKLPGFGDGMADHDPEPQPCYKCPVACCYDVTIDSGKHEGYTATLSGGGENQEGASSVLGCGADDPGVAWFLTDHCDRLGLETSTAGCALAVAFEAFEEGIIDEEDTGGLELTWGNDEAAEELYRQYAHREGFGDKLADGPETAAERLGVPEKAVHIKGAGMNLHDWRRGWGVMLGQIVGGGSGWPAPGADCWTPEPDVGFPEKPDPMQPDGKPNEVAATAPKKYWEDIQGTCWFATWGLPGVLEWSAKCTAAATGWDDFDYKEALKIGERSVTLERILNMRLGLTAEDDIDIPQRLAEPSPDGPAEGKAIGPYVEGWVKDYYELMGWHRETGKPLRETLERLDLEEYIDEVWG